MHTLPILVVTAEYEPLREKDIRRREVISRCSRGSLLRAWIFPLGGHGLRRHPGQSPWPRPATGRSPRAGRRSEREHGIAVPIREDSSRWPAQPVCSTLAREAGLFGAQDRPRFDKFSRAISAN